MINIDCKTIACSLKGEKTDKEVIILAAVAAGITVSHDNVKQLDDFARIIELYVLDKTQEKELIRIAV